MKPTRREFTNKTGIAGAAFGVIGVPGLNAAQLRFPVAMPTPSAKALMALFGLLRKTSVSMEVVAFCGYILPDPDGFGFSSGGSCSGQGVIIGSLDMRVERTTGDETHLSEYRTPPRSDVERA